MKDPLGGFHYRKLPNDLPKTINLLNYRVREITKGYRLELATSNTKNTSRVHTIKLYQREPTIPTLTFDGASAKVNIFIFGVTFPLESISSTIIFSSGLFGRLSLSFTSAYATDHIRKINAKNSFDETEKKNLDQIQCWVKVGSVGFSTVGFMRKLTRHQRSGWGWWASFGKVYLYGLYWYYLYWQRPTQAGNLWLSPRHGNLTG
ncbi:hypothetical protein Patl1_32962 [Pistacia atlantica]|uniref:Uncharacterized protein n=1 Tax=Pistacia atlantica TaxID=434234 RepID=A0ACC1AR75_9ROSI|nr:hypothetical protein Patl1_32962 [Pistacia atlantica]